MDEDNNIRALDKLLAMLKSAGWECIADEADSYLVVIDANGDPHECWDGGIPNDVNVCIPLSVENAVDYFADPNQIYLKDENAKLRELVSDMWRFTGAACKKYPRLFDPAAQGGQMVQLNALDSFEQRMQELGIEATT